MELTDIGKKQVKLLGVAVIALVIGTLEIIPSWISMALLALGVVCIATLWKQPGPWWK